MSATRRKLLAIAATLGTATVLQATPGGCLRYGMFEAFTAVDFCAIVNCQGGTFFDFCEPIPILLDCPNLVAAAGP